MDASLTLGQGYWSGRPPYVKDVKVRLKEPIPPRSESMTNEPQFRPVLQTRLMTSIKHKRYELITPLPLEIRCIDHEYIVKFPAIDIFAFGNDSDDTVAEFIILLVDYYKSLLRKEKSLAVNLRKELEILKEYLGKK
jgi:hypothetical protein